MLVASNVMLWRWGEDSPEPMLTSGQNADWWVICMSTHCHGGLQGQAPNYIYQYNFLNKHQSCSQPVGADALILRICLLASNGLKQSTKSNYYQAARWARLLYWPCLNVSSQPDSGIREGCHSFCPLWLDAIHHLLLIFWESRFLTLPKSGNPQIPNLDSPWMPNFFKKQCTWFSFTIKTELNTKYNIWRCGEQHNQWSKT